MLLTAGPPAACENARWAIEVKFDGIRAQVRIDGTNGVRALAAPAATAAPSRAAASAEDLSGDRVILDGELVHLAADVRPDFSALRRRLTDADAGFAARASARHPATLILFDVLHLDADATRALPNCERRAMLVDLLADGLRRRASDRTRASAPRPHARARAEDVVGKRLDAGYGPGRRSDRVAKLKQPGATRRSPSPGGRRASASPAASPSPASARGQPAFAGAVQLGPTANAVKDYARPAASARPARAATPPVSLGVALVVSAHGPDGGPLRDAVSREMRLGPGSG